MTAGLVRALAASARHGKALLAVAILGDVLVPPLAHALRGAVGTAVVALSTLVLLRVDIPATLRHLRRPLRIIAVVTVQMLVCPMLAWSLVRIVGSDPILGDATVLFATAPALVSAPAFARQLGLDPELALLGALLGTMLVPISAPPMAWALTAVHLAISPVGFSARMAVVVGLPLLLSAVARQLLGACRLEAIGPALDGVTVWVLVALGLGIMDGVGVGLAADPVWVLGAIALAFLAIIILNLLTAAASLPFGAEAAATAGMLSGFRSMALYLAVLPTDADPGLAMFFGLYQITLYIAPLAMAPIYARMLGPRLGADHAGVPPTAPDAAGRR